MALPADSIGVHARLQPERLVARDLTTGETLTYREMDRLVGALAARLLARGCVPGDRVAVIARNAVWLVALHFACGRAGLIYVPLNWRLGLAELLPMIEAADPRLLFGDGGDEAARLAEVAVVEPLADLVADAADCAPLTGIARDPDRPSLILFTSGTSGRSKGVVLTERNLHQTAVNFGTLTRVGNQSVFLCEAPMFHIIGLVTNIRPVLLQGGTILVSDGFDAARTLARLADPALGVSHYVGVPQMMEALRRQPGFDANRLRGMTALVSGGAPHGLADLTAWLDDGLPLVLGYGMSEAGTVFGMSADVDVIRAHIGSVGIAMPSLETRLVRADGTACAAGEAGELLLRGAAITPGYWRNAEETARAIDAQGWFATGDIARCDEQGFFWIVDRKKDMFISGGENVYPAEIELLLADYPGIRECALVGVPDARWGEVGHLAVAAVSGFSVDEAALLAFLEERLARYKLPKRVTMVDQLPRTATGKVQKARLRAILIEGGG